MSELRGSEPLPHLLILTCTDDFDPEAPDFWDEAEIRCPHEPSPLMPCAAFGRWCHCKPRPAETDDWGFGVGPCSQSASGEHHYFEGEPMQPIAECWPALHADHLWDAVWPLQLGPGRYTVFPQCDDEGLMLSLWSWVEQARVVAPVRGTGRS